MSLPVPLTYIPAVQKPLLSVILTLRIKRKKYCCLNMFKQQPQKGLETGVAFGYGLFLNLAKIHIQNYANKCKKNIFTRFFQIP